MSVQVTVNGMVLFAPNIGCLILDVRAALDDPSVLLDALEKAERHMKDQHLVDACCGGQGPLRDAGSITFERYLSLLDGIERDLIIAAATKQAKRRAMAARRIEFSIARPELVLSLLDNGAAYVCAAPGCGEITDLAVDHKHPLSRGGTDSVGNLQFLCKSCNSSKSDRTMEEWLGHNG